MNYNKIKKGSVYETPCRPIFNVFNPTRRLCDIPRFYLAYLLVC